MQRAADILNKGKKIAMLVGAGCLSATDEIIGVAERLGAGVAKSLLGKVVVPDDLPYVTGSLGLLGTRPSWDMMQDCDTLFMVGSAFPYSEFLPKPGSARGVQIDIDGANLSLRYPMEYSLIGDSAEMLRALLPMLKQKTDTAWRKTVEEGVASWWKTLEERPMVAAEPINPQRVFWELSPLLPENCILTTDSGSVANWYARDIGRAWPFANSPTAADLRDNTPVARRPLPLPEVPLPGEAAMVRAARRLNRAAGMIAASMLADSAMEHYRGDFHNRAMWTPIVSAALSVAVSVHGHTDRRMGAHRRRDLAYAAAGLTGVIGTGFHLYNITKKPGGLCWQNLFYSAPIGAPAALSLSGLKGFLSERVRAN